MLVLGIAGSPRKGNTEMMVKAALEGAAAIEGIETEFYSLHGKRIRPCIDCGKCPVEGTWCAFKDDMQEVYAKILAAQGIIFGAPVYFGTVNAQAKALMDRCRPLGRAGTLMRFKVGGAVTVGCGRHAGEEVTLRAILDYFLMCGMITVSHPGYTGAAGLAWKPGMVESDKWRAEQNPEGELDAFRIARLVGLRVGYTTSIVTEGLKAVDPKRYFKERIIPPQA